MWSTNGGERNPVKLFEEWLEHRPDVLKKSGPINVTIIPRPTSNTWYSKTRLGQHRIGQIMKSAASCLPPEFNKPPANLVTRLFRSQDMFGNPPWMIITKYLSVKDKNYLTSPADACQHNSARHRVGYKTWSPQSGPRFGRNLTPLRDPFLDPHMNPPPPPLFERWSSQ